MSKQSSNSAIRNPSLKTIIDATKPGKLHNPLPAQEGITTASDFCPLPQVRQVQKNVAFDSLMKERVALLRRIEDIDRILGNHRV